MNRDATVHGARIDFHTGERFHQIGFAPADALGVLALFRQAGLEPCVYVRFQNSATSLDLGF